MAPNRFLLLKIIKKLTNIATFEFSRLFVWWELLLFTSYQNISPVTLTVHADCSSTALLCLQTAHIEVTGFEKVMKKLPGN